MLMPFCIVILYSMQNTPLPHPDLMVSSPRLRRILTANGFSFVDIPAKNAILSDSWVLLGLTEEDFIGQFPVSKAHPDDRVSFENFLEKLRHGDSDKMEGQYRFLLASGDVLWLSVTIHILERDTEGSPAFFMVRDENITALVGAQEEIRERLVEIESLKDLIFSINKSLDFDETITRIIEHLHRIIPFDRASVQTLDGSNLRIIGSYGYPEPYIRDLSFPIKGIDNPAARALSSRRPIICNDVEHDFQGFVSVNDFVTIKSWLGIPLVYEGRAIGLFALDSSKPGFYTDQHVRIASNVAEHIAIAVEHARQHTIIKEEARTDKLTGTANRYGLETAGQELFAKAAKEDMSVGVLMIDIDFFKALNDSYGHAYGDQVLKSIAYIIAQSLRTKDYLVRYGGEEFVVLLPGATTREALLVAERLRELIPRIEIDPSRKCPTVSIGVFAGVPGLQDLLHEFIRRADLALYEAKQAGRNRCRVWSPKPEYFDRSGEPLGETRLPESGH